MPPHEKKPIHKRFSVDGFSRGFIARFSFNFVFTACACIGERSEPTRILQAHAVVPLAISVFMRHNYKIFAQRYIFLDEKRLIYNFVYGIINIFRKGVVTVKDGTSQHTDLGLACFNLRDLRISEKLYVGYHIYLH